MHPWHDIYVDDHLISKVFPVVIEVPMGSKNKYELDKESGLMRLDRVLYSAVYYPANYGFIPARSATATRSTRCFSRARASDDRGSARARSADAHARRAGRRIIAVSVTIRRWRTIRSTRNSPASTRDQALL
jgi:hypothetical protein